MVAGPRTKVISGLLGVVALASCSTTPPQEARSPGAQQELEKALAGRVPGKPVSCIANYRARDMQIIDDWTILFKDGRTVYVQNPRGGCPGIASHGNVLVNRPFGTTDLCSGDINRLIDSSTGIGGGSCVFSEFVPYTKAS